MHSRIYKGWVEHRRVAPRAHRFRYRLFMMYIDLTELPNLFEHVPFWSARRRAPAYFRRRDYLGPPELPLDVAVKDLVALRLGSRPAGPVRMLTHLRYFGYCFNPVTFYYCYESDGQSLHSIVAEITNTPWRERHQYVLKAARNDLQRFEFDKDFHVSPFMPMDMAYHWSFRAPGRKLFVHMRNLQRGTRTFDATLFMQGSPVTRASLLKLLVVFPLMTLRVVAAIHWQALRLWLKRTPIYDHPELKAMKDPL